MGDEKFNSVEAQQRFEAALRGARVAEALPMKDIPPKRHVGGNRKRALAVKDRGESR
jgi:hypothetical protein